MKKNNKGIALDKIVSGKRVPILTLDQKWHALFYNYEKSQRIKELEHGINSLLKKQGKLTTDIKGMRSLKPKLMNGIIQNMNPDSSKEGMVKGKKLDKSQKLIHELNGKLTNAEDELIHLPYEIKSMNEQLMIESAKVCYKRIKENKSKISESEQWILKTRNELKERIIEKQDMEATNALIYSYMHDLLGADMVELLDKDMEN